MKLRLLVLVVLVQSEQVRLVLLAQEPRLALVAVAAVELLPGSAVAEVAVGLPLAVRPVGQSPPYPHPLSSDVRSAPCCAAVLPLPDSSR